MFTFAGIYYIIMIISYEAQSTSKINEVISDK